MSVILKQFKLIEMSTKKICLYILSKYYNVPDTRMFTGSSFHSRGAAAPNAESGLSGLGCGDTPHYDRCQ